MTDANSVIRAVNQAEEVHDGLEVRGDLRSHSGPSSAGASESRPPVDIGMMDLATHIQGLMQLWTRLVHEESGDELPPDTIADQAQYMRQRAIWIAGAEWAPDMIDELEAAARKGVGMLGLLPPRSPLPEPCNVCGAQQWIYHERPPIVRCREEHESQLVEHMQGRGTETVSHEQAAWVLGVKRTAVSMAIKRGTLRAGEQGGVTIESLRVRLAKVSA